MATVTQRGNSYRIAVSCGYDINGKQKRHYMTWQALAGNSRFADFAEKWFSEYAEKQLRPSTVAG